MKFLNEFDQSSMGESQELESGNQSSESTVNALNLDQINPEFSQKEESIPLKKEGYCSVRTDEVEEHQLVTDGLLEHERVTN